MKFDIQKFADTITSAMDAKFNMAFDDGDTRTITLKNAKMSYCTSENAATLNAWIVANQPIVGDKSGTSSTTGIVDAYIEEKTTNKLDLS